MGAVGGLLGVGGGANGTGFNPESGTNSQQLKTSYQQNQDLLNALAGQNAFQNQSNVYNQLQGVASGQGPSPAQAMLNQATGQNVANQASLMAGQRGAAANPALIARQAAMQGATAQQQAAGQGATMQANQSLGAIEGAGNLANTMAQNRIGATQTEQANLLGANSNNAAIQGQLANTNMQGQQKLLGGIGNAVGSITGLFAEGGAVPSNGPQSRFGQMLRQMPMANGGNVGNELKSGGHVPGQPKVGGDSLKNDTVHAMLSPGEIVLPRTVVNSKDPVSASARFVADVLAKKRVKG